MTCIEIEIGKRTGSASSATVHRGEWDGCALDVSLGGAQTARGRVPLVRVLLDEIEFSIYCDTPRRLVARGFAERKEWNKLLLFCFKHSPPKKLMGALAQARAAGVREGRAQAQAAMRAAMGIEERAWKGE